MWFRRSGARHSENCQEEHTVTTKMKTLRAENADRIESLKQAVSDGRDANDMVVGNTSAKVASGRKKPLPSPPSPATL